MVEQPGTLTIQVEDRAGIAIRIGQEAAEPELQERGLADLTGAPKRVDGGTRSTCSCASHVATVDFRPVHCKPGSLLVVRPEQAHNFGLQEDWDGWMVLFRPESIQSSPAVPDLRITAGLDRLDAHMSLMRTSCAS